MSSRRDEALALLHRGHEAHRRGDLPRASSDYRRATALLPDLADGPYLLAIAQLQGGEAGQAAIRLKALLHRFPPSAAIAVNLGLAHTSTGEAAAAAAAFRRAAALDPGDATSWIELGNQCARAADYAGACLLFGRAVGLDPMDAVALGNLGSAMAARGSPSAGGWLRRSLASSPASARTWINAGHGLRECREWLAAGRAYDRAATVEPSNATAQSEALHARLQAADWNDLPRRITALGAALGRGGAAPPFHLLALDLPPSLKRANAERWSAQYSAGRISLRPSMPGGRLRLGYIGGDFRRHAVAYEMIGLFEAHDRQRVDLFAYSWSPDDGSDIRARLEQVFGGIVDLGPMSDVAAAARIAADAVDVLIDLSGHTYGARPGILARRPAPVQVNYFGFPGVTGATYHDYVLADAVVAPEVSDESYREAIVRLPGCYWPHDPRLRAGATPDRARLGLPPEAIVLVCFNQVYKIQPTSFAMWMKIMRSVQDSVLWLLDHGPVARGNLQLQAARQGIDVKRLVFAPPAAHDEHLSRIGAADLAIDTLPYNAHTTASDALSIGCPMATWIGTDFAGRVCASMLADLGFDDLIAEDADAYADLVTGIARDRARLDAVRERLRARLKAGPLFAMDRLARSVEAAATEMTQRHRAGLAAEGFYISTDGTTRRSRRSA